MDTGEDIIVSDENGDLEDVVVIRRFSVKFVFGFEVEGFGIVIDAV